MEQYVLVVPIFRNLRGAFHSTKDSGLKFWVFLVANGTVFSGRLRQPVTLSFARKYKINQSKQMADSLPLLLATTTLKLKRTIFTTKALKKAGNLQQSVSN